MAIDAKTREMLDVASRRAVKDGRDLFEVLDGVTLVLTPARRKEIEIQALEMVWHKLDELQPADVLRVFTGSGSGTPADMYRAVLDWLEALINDRVKGEVS